MEAHTRQQMRLHTERKFDAAHFLPGYDGPCQNLHGHTWRVVVDLYGVKNPKTGMLVDFKHVKNIIDVFDHCCINDECGIKNPTAENLSEYFAERFLKLSCVNKVVVKVYESETSYIEVIKEIL